jgi:alpha-1,2-mannosyltransferase
VPPNDSPDTPRVNAHPPPAVLLALPFACLPYPAALESWRLVCFALILGCASVIRRQLGPLPAALTPPAPVAALLLLLSGPVLLTIFQGQLLAVLLACVVGAWWADRAGHPQLAGALLGVAGAVKLTPILLLGYFALRARRRAVAAGLLAFVAVNGGTLAVLGPDAFRDYAAALPRVGDYFRSGRTNASLPGLFAKLFHPAEARPITPLVHSPEWERIGVGVSLAAVAALTAGVIYRARSRSEQDRAFGLSLVALLLAGPLSWEFTLLLLMLPLTLLAQDWPAWGLARRTLFLAAAAAVWLMPYTLYEELALKELALKTPAGPLETLTLLSYQCWALLALFGLGLASTRDRT